MIKKIRIVIPIVLILIIIFPLVKNTKKELLIYLDQYFITSQDIITIEYSDDGAYIYKNYSEDYNVCFYMRKTYFGWKYDSDVHVGVEVLGKQSGYTLTSLPIVSKAANSVYFGKILDKEISKITFHNIDTNEIKDTSVTLNNGTKLWTFYVDDLENEQFIISSFTKDDVLVSEVEITQESIKYKYYMNIDKNTILKTIDR